MKYKIVNVLTAYAENSVDDIEIENSDLDVANFAEMVGERLVKAIIDGGEYGDEESVREFFGFAKTVEVGGLSEVGMVDYGEENILVLVPEGHEWYEKVKYDMEDDVYDEWVAYMNEVH